MQRLPAATKHLLVWNVLIFLFIQLGPTDLTYVLGMRSFLLPGFHVWQLFTYMFVHTELMHMFFNMIMLWMFGRIINETLGTKRFLILYFSSGVFAAILQQVVWLLFGWTVGVPIVIGASGALSALLVAFCLIYSEQELFVFPIPFPIKGRWMLIIFATYSFVAGLLSLDPTIVGETSWLHSFVFGIAHFTHLGGMLGGLLLLRYWKKHPYGLGSDSGFSLTDWWRNFQWKRATKQPQQPSSTGRPDWDWNAQQQREQEEVDRILDKIRKSGYDSLSREEKQRLFDQSKKK